jgi:hypothetical protein
MATISRCSLIELRIVVSIAPVFSEQATKDVAAKMKMAGNSNFTK